MMSGGPGMGSRQQQDESNQRPQYSMPGILHFLQTEWARFEMERSQWEVERAELQVKYRRMLSLYIMVQHSLTNISYIVVTTNLFKECIRCWITSCLPRPFLFQIQDGRPHLSNWLFFCIINIYLKILCHCFCCHANSMYTLF